MTIKVAIVTGANRGIGYETVRQLCSNFRGHVYLTCRMTDKGKEVIRNLECEGLKPFFHELDITQPASIRMFEEYIKENYGGIDILINNAGVTYPKNEYVPLVRQAQLSVGTDFKGTLNMCRIFMPHLRPHGRVVILTNGYIGKRADLGDKINKRIDINKVTLHDLNTLMDEYMMSVKNGTHKNFGWPESPSKVAKTFVSLLAVVLARLHKDDMRENLLINACCPGWTLSSGSELYMEDSGMCDGIKPKSVSDATQDVVWLATLPAGTETPNGKVVRYKETIDF